MDCGIRESPLVDRQSQAHLSVLSDAVRVRELIVVLRALEDADARPLVFKGAALAHTHYQASWQRPRCDADILIAPQSRTRVVEVLEALGYQRPPLISGDLVMYQTAFARIDHLGIEHALDIHWRVVNPQVVSQALTHEELVERSVMVRLQDGSMRVPSAVDSLLIACLHRVHHPAFEQPCWIEDIHLLASRLDPSEWRAFTARATSRSIRALCLDGLRRAEEQFHTDLPPDVITVLSADTSEPSAVYLRHDLRPVDRLRADLRVLGPRQATRLIGEHLFPPASYMQAKYGIRSRAWLPAYYAMRVLNGMSKWLSYVSATR
jgi:hypothetical protein